MTDIIDFKRTLQFILIGNPRLGRLVEVAVSKIPELGEVFYKGRFRWRHYLASTPFSINIHRTQCYQEVQSLVDAINTDIHYTARALETSFYEIMQRHGTDIAKTHFLNCSVENLKLSDFSKGIGPATVREDYFWPTCGDLSTEFFEGAHGLPIELEKRIDEETRKTFGLFFHLYDGLCGALEKGHLFATGRRHKDAPDILVPAEVWGASETRVDWLGGTIFPTKDDRIVAAYVEVPINEGEATKHAGGRPPIHPWELAMPGLLEKIASDGLPDSVANLARLLLDSLEPFCTGSLPDEGAAAKYLKNKHQSLHEVTKIRSNIIKRQN